MLTDRRRTILVVDWARTCFGGIEQVILNVLPRLHGEWRVVFCNLMSNPQFDQSLCSAGPAVLHLLPAPRRDHVGGKHTWLRPIYVAAKLPWWFRSLLRLRKWIQRHRPEIVYFNRQEMIHAFAAAVPRDVACVYHAHGFQSESDVRSSVIRRLNRRFGAVIAVSEKTRSQLIEAGLARAKAHVVYNGIDVETFRKRAESTGNPLPNRDPTEIVFVQVGAVAAHKGQDVSIDALAQLDNRRAQLWICGDIPAEAGRPYLAMLEARIAEHGLAGRVAFLGWRSDVARVIAAADVMVLPSSYESFGMVLAEGMALRKPCIGTSRGGVPEVVVDGETGFVCEPTAAEFSAAMAKLVDQPCLRETMGQRGFARVNRVFSIDNQAAGISSVLRRLIPVE